MDKVEKISNSGKPAEKPKNNIAKTRGFLYAAIEASQLCISIA
jgi:hypothetical protein